MSEPATSPEVTDARRLLGATATAAVGAVLIGIGGIFALTTGLIVVAAAVGLVIGWFMRGLSGGPTAGPLIAAVLAVGGVAIGQILLWLVANAEGGVLGPVDYLAQTFGALVVAQLVVAGVGAWLAAR